MFCCLCHHRCQKKELFSWFVVSALLSACGAVLFPIKWCSFFHQIRRRGFSHKLWFSCLQFCVLVIIKKHPEKKNFSFSINVTYWNSYKTAVLQTGAQSYTNIFSSYLGVNLQCDQRDGPMRPARGYITTRERVQCGPPTSEKMKISKKMPLRLFFSLQKIEF